MNQEILDKYDSKRILAVYHGDDAWKKLVPIRWHQVAARATTRRRFKKTDMTNSLLIVFVSPKNGPPTKIGAHFYPNKKYFDCDIDGMETDDCWITSAPYSALEADDAPKLLKKLTKHLS